MICHMICILEAPSTLAASFNSSSIPVMAAMYMIADQPAFFHVSHTHILNHTCSEDCRKSCGESIRPRLIITELTTPVLFNRQ